jgi:hypothetical protein
MALDQERYAAGVLARLCVEKAFGGGRMGVFAENVPAVDARTFVATVAELSPGKARVALLGSSGSFGRAAKIDVTTDPMVANKWRNDPAARAAGIPSIFLVLGPARKLNSLRTAVPVLTAADIRAEVVRRCKALLDTPERAAFYDAVAERTGEIPTASLLLFAGAVEAASAKSKASLLDAEPVEVRRLGLLPSELLFSASGPALARRIVRKNVDLVADLRELNAAQRAHLAKIAETGHALSDRAHALLRFESTGRFEDLGDLTVEQIEETLKVRIAAEEKEKEKEATPAASGRRARVDGDALALDLLLTAGGRGLTVAAKQFGAAIDPDPDGGGDDEISVGKRTYLARPKVGTAQATSVFARLATEEVWGGLITTEDAVDFVGAQKRLESGDVDVEEFRPGGERHVRGTLERAVDQGIVKSHVLKRWDAYAEARAGLLPYLDVLINHPLLALGGERGLGDKATATLEAYTKAIEAIRETWQALRAHNASEGARRLVACTLALDVAFIRSKDEFAAVASPTHPFHLWRWLTLRTVLGEHADELQSIGREALEPLVTDPPSVCPQIILSPFALQNTALDRARPFVATGSFAALPLFGEPTARQLGRFRARSLSKLADSLLRLMPHAAYGLRVALIDPPSVAGALEDLIDLRSPVTEERVPIHATVLRTRAPSEATDEEHESVSNLARELEEQGGTLSVSGQIASLKEAAERLERAPAHLAVVFDPGVGERIAIGLDRPPKLSPLVVPRAYRYDAFDDRLDVVVAGDAEPFATYHEMFCETFGVPQNDFVGRRSGASQSARELQAIAASSIWTVVVDQAIEPTLKVGAAERLDWRTDGGRDLVTFTSHPETVDDLVADAIRAAGLVPDEEMRKRVLRDLFLLSGEAVLALARPRPGVSLVEPRFAKGTIGALAAYRWYSDRYPDSLVISLDDSTSRRWILGVASDDRHGDLVGIRPGPKGIMVQALEVKAHDAEDAGVRIHGAHVEGRAAIQVDQTIHTLRAIFGNPKESPVLRARLDILRDQLYRAVAARPYPRERRARYVALLEELFEKGPVAIDGMIFRVQIASGKSERGPEPPAPLKSPAGNNVSVVDLVEGGTFGKFRSPPPPKDVPPGGPPKGGGSPKGGGGGAAPGAQAKPAPQGKQPRPPKVPAHAVAPETPPARTNGAAARMSAAVSVLIGTTPGGSQVFWEPHRKDAPLNNFGILVTGDSGAGKTQILKVLIAAAADRQLPVCIFDFKNDYAEPAFAKRHHLSVYDVDREGLPFNPLALIPDDRGEAQPIRQVHELCAILARIYELGSQQEARLRKAIVASYEAHGIRVDARVAVAGVADAPGLPEVKELLEQDDKNEALLNRLSPLFDLNLFPSGAGATTFEKLMHERVVLDLHRLPDDRIKGAVSEFIIVRLHGYVLKGEQPRELRRLLVFDEAWRVAHSVRLQELAREGRAFGVGIIVGTQFPGDIPENLAGNLATQLLLANQDADHRRSVVRTLCGSTSGAEASRLTGQLAHLQKHEGFFRNQQYAPYTLVKTLPYYQREA